MAAHDDLTAHDQPAATHRGAARVDGTARGALAGTTASSALAGTTAWGAQADADAADVDPTVVAASKTLLLVQHTDHDATVAQLGLDLVCEVAGVLSVRLADALGVRADLIKLHPVGIDTWLVPVDVADPVAQLVARLTPALRRPVVIGGDVVQLDIRAGVSPPAQLEPAARIRQCHQAMATTDGRSIVRCWSPALATEEARTQQLTHDIAELLTTNLTVHYQPIRDLHDGRVVMVEALARLEHPRHGLMTAGEFLHAVSAAGLHDLLLRSVLRRSIPQIAVWRRRAPWLRLTLNVLAPQLDAPWLLTAVDDLCAMSGTDPSALIFECVETHAATTSPEAVARIRGRGIGLAVDDFGAGYSTHRQVAQLSPDIVKVDGEVMAELGDDSAAQSTAGLAISLGACRNMMVVAEGIERPDQVRALRQLQCRYGQGYLLGRPAPADQLDLRPVDGAAIGG